MNAKNEPYIGEPMRTLAKEKEDTNVSPNIYQRIIQVMKEVDYIQKKDKAAKGLMYNYISHDQVTGALHMPMAKAGIVCVTDVVEFTQEGNRTRVKVNLYLINADNPQDRLEIYSYGYGIDQQDKGPGKAISYATKMALLKCFMLETGDDPEKDNIDYKPDDTQKYNHAYWLILQLPKQRQTDFSLWLKETYKVDKIEGLKNRDEIDFVIKKLEAEIRKNIKINSSTNEVENEETFDI